MTELGWDFQAGVLHQATGAGRLADGAAVTQVEVDVTNNATVVVQQDEVSGAFISFATLIDVLVIALALEAVKMNVIEGTNLDDEAIDVFLREWVALVTNSIRAILRTDLAALHLCITMGVTGMCCCARSPGRSSCLGECRSHRS